MSNRSILSLIFVSGLILYLFEIPNLEVSACRSVLFVLEMKQYGIKGFFPTIYGFPYTDYFSSGTIVIYLISYFGKFVNSFTCALPNAVLGSLTLVFIYKIGSKISKYFAYCTVALTLVSAGYFIIVRSLNVDIYTTFASTLSFYLIYTADTDNTRKKLLFIPLLLLFGFAFRGPIGMVIPAGIICMYYVVNHNWRMLLISSASSAFLFIGCLLIASYLCLMQGGESFLNAFLNDQIFGRMQRNETSWFFYFREGAIIFFPTLPLSFFACIIYFKRVFFKELRTLGNNEKLLKSSISWMLTILIGMSIPECRFSHYILPAIPASALIGAYLLTNPTKNSLCELFKRSILFACKVFPLATLLAYVAFLITLKVLNIKSPVISTGYLLGFILLFIANVYLIRKNMKNNFKKNLLCLVATITLLVVYVTVTNYTYEYLSSRYFFSKIESAKDKSSKVAFFNIRPDNEDLHYIFYTAEKDRSIPEFIALQDSAIHLKTISQKTGDAQGLRSFIKRSFINLALRSFPSYFTEHQLHFSNKLDNPSKVKLNSPLTLPYSIIFSTNHFLYPVSKFNELPLNTIYITKKNDYESMLKSMENDFQIIAQGRLGNKQCVAFKRVKNLKTIKEPRCL